MASIFSNNVTSAPKVESKSLFGGAKIRKRIEVSLDDLRKYSNDIGVLNEARQQILMTNVDELCMEFVLNWGAHLQANHKNLLEETFTLVSRPSIKESKSLIGQLVDDLNSVKFKKGKFSFITDMFAGGDISPIIKSRSMALESHVPSLFEIRKRLTSINQELGNLSSRLRPFIVTSSFFSEYTKDSFPNGLFVSRLASILTTQTAIEGNKTGNTALINTILNLISVIQDVVKTEIPLWLGNYINYLANPNDNSLEQQQLKLIQRCNSI